MSFISKGKRLRPWFLLLMVTNLGAAGEPATKGDVPPAEVAIPAATRPANVPAPFTLEDWEDHILTPVTPTRSQLVRGDDGKTPAPKYTPPPPAAAKIVSSRLPQAPAESPTPKAKSDDERLAVVAVEDRDFFQTLAKNPKTWSNDERDRRAQAIHDEYLHYLIAYPSDVNALVLYGKLLARTGQGEMAYEAFRHADALDPGLAVVKQQLANHLAETGHYQLALELFHQATALAPKEPLYHYQIGELFNIYYESFLADKVLDLAALNKTMAAEFARAAELAPQQPAYAWRYAESFYDMVNPDWTGALAAWSNLAERTTNPALLEMIRLHTARALLELGRLAEARPLIEHPVLPALEASRLELARRLAKPSAPGSPAPLPGNAGS